MTKSTTSNVTERAGQASAAMSASAALRPNLFIIGAMKSGTSSLHSYLGAHPDIFMCEPKEPCYFVDRGQLNWPTIERLGFWRSEENYLALFNDAGAATVIGESSTLYTKAPRISGVPERIARFNRDARLIYIMRDPVERTISHYWHMVRHRGEWRDPLIALRSSPEYTEVSHYAMQIELYARLFGMERIYTLTTEELIAHPKQTMARILAWLEVDSGFVPPNLNQRENATPRVVEQVRMRGWLERLRFSSIWDRVGPWFPRRVRAVGREYATRQLDRLSQSMDDVHDYLRPIQLSQTEELVRLLRRPFREWTTLYNTPRGACNKVRPG